VHGDGEIIEVKGTAFFCISKSPTKISDVANEGDKSVTISYRGSRHEAWTSQKRHELAPLFEYCQDNANIKVLCHLPARRLFRGPWRWKMSIYFTISCGVGGVKIDINWSSVASGSTLIRPSILPDSGRT
jgi:hypothetical protein